MSNGIIKHKVEQGDNIGDYVCHLDGWTTEPPKEPGLYKAKNKNGVVFWAYYLGRGYTFVQLFGISDNLPFSFITHWLGPLPEPEPPKE